MLERNRNYTLLLNLNQEHSSLAIREVDLSGLGVGWVFLRGSGGQGGGCVGVFVSVGGCLK